MVLNVILCVLCYTSISNKSFLPSTISCFVVIYKSLYYCQFRCRELALGAEGFQKRLGKIRTKCSLSFFLSLMPRPESVNVCRGETYRSKFIFRVCSIRQMEGITSYETKKSFPICRFLSSIRFRPWS